MQENNQNLKKILYIDLDGVCANFDKMMGKLLPGIPMGDGNDYEIRSKMVDKAMQDNPYVFEYLELVEGAIEAVEKLKNKYEIYFLSTPMCKIPESYMGKRIWIRKYFGEWADKRLILSHRKDLLIGDYLIDDRTKNGAGEFKGHFLQFGSKVYPNWDIILNYLL